MQKKSELPSPGGRQKVDFAFLCREYFTFQSSTEISQRDELLKFVLRVIWPLKATQGLNRASTIMLSTTGEQLHNQ